MANKQQLNYDIKFSTDMTSLEELQEALINIKNMSTNQYIKLNGATAVKSELASVQATAAQVGIAIENSFNPKLNTFNFTKFEQILKATDLNIEKISADFQKLGPQGQRAFRSLTESLYTTNAQLKKSKSFLDSIGDTLINAAKWSVAYGVINNLTNGIKSAWSYATSLDSALNDIRIVTGKSSEDMEKFAKSANKAAKSLGTSTMDYTKGSLIYYQQGLSQRDVVARTAVSAKTANVTGQSMQEVSEELTAVWNGYKVTADETEEYVDKLAAVAAASASDLEELSTAMSRVASSASTMGINIDQLTAQIATIESVTRQDAASIGTALKTIYSRMGDLAIGAEDEFGVALGDVSGKMKQMGIDILDQAGNMRSMGTIIEEVAAKWSTWTSAQQQAAAVALAGKRQYNNLFALFENWDMYESNKTVSENSLGELQKQQDIYMESTRAHIEQLKTSAEGLKDSFFNNESMNNLIDILSHAVSLIDGMIKGLGGGGNTLITIFSNLGLLFSKKISTSLVDFVSSFKSAKENATMLEARTRMIQQYGAENDEVIKEITKIEQQRLQYAKYLTESENEKYNVLIKEKKELVEQKEALEGIKNNVDDLIQSGNTQAMEQAGEKGKQIYYRDNLGKFVNKSAEGLANLSNKDKEKALENIKNEQNRTEEKYSESISNISFIKKFDGTKKKTSVANTDAKRAANEEIKLVKEQLKVGTLNVKQQEALQKALDNVAATQDNLNDIELNTYEKRKAMNALCVALNQSYVGEQKNLGELTHVMTTYTAEVKANTAAQEQNNEEVDELGNKGKWTSITEGITQVVSMVGQAWSATQSLVSSIQEIINVFDDVSMSGPEKVEKIIGIIVGMLTAALPVIVTCIKAIGDKSAEAAAEGSAKITASLGWIGLILAAVAALISLIVALAKVIGSQKSSLEKATEAYQNANESLQEMQQNLQDVKKAYEDLIESIENYQTARDGIDKLKAGTEEWEQAIISANEKALALIGIYSELANAEYMFIDENGLITINNAGLEYIKKQQQQQVRLAQANTYWANANVYKTANNTKKEAFLSATWDPVAIKAGIEWDKTPTKDNPLKLDIEYLMNFAYESRHALDELYQRELERAKEDPGYLSSGETEFDKLLEGIQMETDMASQLKDTLRSNIQATIANEKAAVELKKQYVKNLLIAEENEIFSGAQDQNAVTSIISSKMNDIADKYEVGSDRQMNKNNDFKSTLAASLGIDENQIISIKDGKITYKDTSGEHSISTEEAVKKANTYNAEKEVEKNLAAIVEVTNKLINSGYGALNELAGGKSRASLTGLTIGQLNSDAYFNDAKNQLTQQQAEALGYKDIKNGPTALQQYQAAIDESRALSQREYKKHYRNISKLSSVKLLQKDNYTIDSIKQIEAAAENFYSATGRAGTDALVSLLNSRSTEEAETIAKIASQIDITDIDAVETFNARLKEEGIVINENDEAYQAFIQALNSANNVLVQTARNVDKIHDKLIEINKLTKDLDIGSVISEDDYKKIITMYSGAKEFFVRTADGYRMIAGSSKEIQKGMKQRFSNLSATQDYFASLNNIGKNKLNNQNFQAGATGDALTKQGNILKNILGNDLSFVLEYAGIDFDQFNSAMAAGNNRTTTQTTDLQKVIQAAQEIAATAEGSGFSSEAAVQLYFTKNGFGGFGTWSELQKNNDFNKLNTEERNKIRQSWLADYADELGVSLETINALSEKFYKNNDEGLLRSLNILNTYEDQIKALSNLAKNLSGEDLANNYKEQNKVLVQVQKYQQRIVKSEKEELGAKGNSYLALLKEYNKIYSTLKDEDKEKWDKLLEDAEKAESITSSIADNIISSIDAVLQGVKETIDWEKSYYEFRKTYYINGSTYGKSGFEIQDGLSIMARADINAFNSTENIKQINAVKRAMAELDTDTILTEEQKAKKRQELNQQLLSATQTEIDNINELYQIWADGWSEIADKCDKYISKIEFLNTLYDKQIGLQKITNKNAFDKELLDSQAENMKKIIEANQLKYQQDLDDYNNAKTDEQRKAAEERMKASAEGYISAVEAYYKKLKSNFETAINNIYIQYGISDASERWERASVGSDMYLNPADAQLNINKIRRQFQSSIDSANSLTAQIKLRNVMEEQLKILQQKDKLSQYEVDRANAVYELTLKQIALEESQRNASKMKLVRDSNGNLTYAFAQDQDATAQAQAELEEAQNNLFNIDNNELRSQIDSYYQYQSEAQSALAEAAAAGDQERFNELKEYYYGSDGILTKIQDKIKEIQPNIEGTFKSIFPDGDVNSLVSFGESIKVATTELANMYDEIGAAYNDFANKYATFVEKDGVLDILNGNVADLVTKITDSIASDTYQKDVSDIADSLKIIAEQLSKGIPDYFKTNNNKESNEQSPWEESVNKSLEEGVKKGSQPLIDEILKGRDTNGNTNISLKDFNQEIIIPVKPTNPNPILAADGNGMNLEQNITINASFPGVNSQNEIMGAFGSLTDQTFQFAGIKK